jgi:hypothetical protein
MARLAEETTLTINSLKQQLLDIVDDTTAVEFALFERFGETERTIPVLEQLKSVAEKTASWFLNYPPYSCGLPRLNPLLLLIC